MGLLNITYKTESDVYAKVAFQRQKWPSTLIGGLQLDWGGLHLIGGGPSRKKKEEKKKKKKSMFDLVTVINSIMRILRPL